MRAYCDTCKKETVVEPRTGLGLAMLFALIFGPLVFCIPRKTTLHCSKCGTMIPVNADNQPVPRCPKCQVFVEESDAFCPKCGAKLIKRISKKGKTFYGCSNYPNCDFAAPGIPTGEKCSECGGYIVTGARGRKYCINSDCPTRKKKTNKEN